MLLKKIFLIILLFHFSFFSIGNDSLRIKRNDSLTLAQAYINLTLTSTYFDSINTKRISKILPFEANELVTIQDTSFIKANAPIYNFTYSLLYYNQAKLQLVTNKGIDRKFLTQWKQTFDKSLVHLSKANISEFYTFKNKDNSFYEFIGFNSKKYNELKDSINALQRRITVYFNLDVYPDFKRILLAAKKGQKNYLDSILFYTSIYNLPLDMEIANLASPGTFKSNYQYPSYRLSIGLNLISEYLQFYYLATEPGLPALDTPALLTLYDKFILLESKINPADPVSFYYNDNIINKDEFFNKELNKTTMDELFMQLQKRFPFELFEVPDDVSAGMGLDREEKILRYYFPNPAPFPSAYKFIYNFQPLRKTMKQVDVYLSSILYNAGYKNHLQYYYVQSGFAITSSLEKIGKDGTPAEASKRWEVSAKGNGSFSFYEVFKSIFFETESSFRMFAFIVAPKQVGLQSTPASFGAMQELIRYSYPSLPKDIENLSLGNKTLSILVYQFVQSDIGEVPMLEVNKPLLVDAHLKKSNLYQIITNR